MLHHPCSPKRKNNEAKLLIIKCNIKPQNAQVDIELNPSYGYRIAGEFYNQIDSTKSIFNRLVGQTSKEFITNIKLYAIDTRNDLLKTLDFDTKNKENVRNLVEILQKHFGDIKRV